MPPERPESRVKVSPQKSTLSSACRTLFNFEDVSKYIIAQSPLCGRLVTCTAGNYKVLGFPVELMEKYRRNYFRFNVCFRTRTCTFEQRKLLYVSCGEHRHKLDGTAIHGTLTPHAPAAQQLYIYLAYLLGSPSYMTC
ncbi:nitrogen permease regulator 2-domain-containing protein [Lactarius hatsudake]|nr:nitrogen permease regulator 2-domain-containing protein [Lactarius hatsudake]